MKFKSILGYLIFMAVLSGCNPEKDDTTPTSEARESTTTEVFNQAPIVNVRGNKTLQVNETVKITGTANDRDGTIISYKWTKGNSVLATTLSFFYTPTVMGIDVLTLTVMDDDGASSSYTIALTITNNTNESQLNQLDSSIKISKILEKHQYFIVNKKITIDIDTPLYYNFYSVLNGNENILNIQNDEGNEIIATMNNSKLLPLVEFDENHTIIHQMQKTTICKNIGILNYIPSTEDFIIKATKKSFNSIKDNHTFCFHEKNNLLIINNNLSLSFFIKSGINAPQLNTKAYILQGEKIIDNSLLCIVNNDSVSIRGTLPEDMVAGEYNIAVSFFDKELNEDIYIPLKNIQFKINESPNPNPNPTPTPTPTPTYKCSDLSESTAYYLLAQGHDYLDRDGDGHPCEWNNTPASTRSNCHWVSGYTRSNGTYVHGYRRCR